MSDCTSNIEIRMVLCVGQTKSRELAEHYSALQRDLDAAESRLDEMAQLNRTLVWLVVLAVFVVLVAVLWH